ncbi:hypothetical protein PLEOSDRAFT_1104964 [Pleurotus ostreatus PC15]|uniref:Uncharacterized protein n=1 Tax=Pleurotus ostreatus (strain PC15) TaxID=1137138 RepID=A0A067NJP8_PLEO1|nr:hypothetical protein PLEOSDRAFT_1104964 [Pleurotus ostreatus PC15]
MSSTTTDEASALRNKSFYMSFSVFQVERELFKIPTAYLTQYSTIFNEMLTPKLPPGAAARGQCDDNPIILDGVSKLDFERFLTTVFRFQVEPTRTFNTAHWLSVLKLASLWGFSDLRQTAITKLSTSEPRRMFTPIGRLELGRQYKIAAWVEQGYTELVDRREKISEEEAEQIGWKALLKLCHLREDFRSPVRTAATTNSGGFFVPAPPPAFMSGSDTLAPLSLSAAPTLTKANLKKENLTLPPPVVTTASAVRQVFSEELREIREAGVALSVPMPRIIAALPRARRATVPTAGATSVKDA